MPRGPHGSDFALFAPERLADLRRAAGELSWLLSRGYAEHSALKLVGDRYALRERQRVALRRSVCTEAQREHRATHRCALPDVRGRWIAVDAFNGLITLESALAGGVLLRGLDGALRDLASVHGSYRRSETTHLALDLMTRQLSAAGPAGVRWFVDRPVSNSGRLRQWISERGPEGLPWEVELPFDADEAILRAGNVVTASADAMLLDRAEAWIDLPDLILAEHCSDAWIVDLGPPLRP